MPFAVGTVVTTNGKKIFCQRVQTTAPGAGSVTPPALGANPPKNCAMGVGATTAARTAAAADVSLSKEVEARVAGTETVTNNVYQSVGTITAGASYAVDEAGLFDTSATTTSSGASAGATTLPLASGVFQATGTVTAINETTPANGAQTITITAGGNTTSATVTALTGLISSGDRICQGNMFTSATFNVINLVSGDSIQFTWQVTVA